MCGFIRALLFIYILFICVDSAPYFLDPPFPPLAYTGQSYELKFQVRGLPQLAFTFEGLPSFFTGSQDGSIKGTPIETGSYKVGVSYSSKNTTGSEQVILSIVTNQTELNSDIVLKMNALQIESSASSWIYYEGETIQIEFWCSDAKEPFTLSYRNLPRGITAQLTVIKGSIAASGLYTFSVFLGDAKGNQGQAYYTLNIQPKIYLTEQSSNKIADVALYSQSSNINLLKVDTDQIKTRNKVQSLYDKLQTKNTQIVAYNNMLLAQQQSLTFDQSFASAQSNYYKILSYIKEATTVIQNLKMQVSLAVKSQNLSIAQAKTAQQIYNSSLSVSQNLISVFNLSSKSYGNIQRQLSQIKKQVNMKVALSISARNNYTLAVNNQEKAKIDLNDAESQSSFASDQASKAQIFRELSMQDRDAAENNLKSIDASLKDAKARLNASIISFNQIRQDFQDAKKQLEIANFSLIIATNSLFIAQAVKQASDKALAIIVAQGNGSTEKLNYNFAGCVQNGRPAFFGTAKILKLRDNTINTSAGHNLVWGDCTKKSILSIGSYIYYEGFIAQDSISVKLIKAVTF